MTRLAIVGVLVLLQDELDSAHSLEAATSDVTEMYRTFYHSIHYYLVIKQLTEWNVCCENCHGPGSTHVLTKLAADIVNPAKLGAIDGTNVCVQCHSQGQPLVKPMDGKYYDWPVGYRP